MPGDACVCGIFNLDRSDAMLPERAAPRPAATEG